MTDTQQNLLIAAIGLIIPTVIAYWLYKRQLRDPSPVYAITGNAIVGKDAKHNEIEILFNGVSVPRVNRALIFLWNRGSGSIRREDVRKPIQLTIPGSEILRASILASTRAEIESDCSYSTASVILSFSHFDHRDGVCVEVLHTGEEANGVEIQGVIIGVPDGVKRAKTRLLDNGPLDLTVLVTGLVMIVVGVWSGLQYNSFGFVFVFLGYLYTTTAIAVLRNDRRRLPPAFRKLEFPRVPRSRSQVKSLLGALVFRADI